MRGQAKRWFLCAVGGCTLALVAGCPGGIIDDGGGGVVCPPPEFGEDFCGFCEFDGFCYYCPAGTCLDECGTCAVFKPDTEPAKPKQRKPILLGIQPQDDGAFKVAVDSGLPAGTDVTWFSNVDGQLETTGPAGSLCLSTPGIHLLTYKARIPGVGEQMFYEPLAVELQ